MLDFTVKICHNNYIGQNFVTQIQDEDKDLQTVQENDPWLWEKHCKKIQGLFTW